MEKRSVNRPRRTKTDLSHNTAGAFHPTKVGQGFIEPRVTEAGVLVQFRRQLEAPDPVQSLAAAGGGVPGVEEAGEGRGLQEQQYQGSTDHCLHLI